MPHQLAHVRRRSTASRARLPVPTPNGLPRGAPRRRPAQRPLSANVHGGHSADIHLREQCVEALHLLVHRQARTPLGLAGTLLGIGLKKRAAVALLLSFLTFAFWCSIRSFFASIMPREPAAFTMVARDQRPRAENTKVARRFRFVSDAGEGGCRR